MKKIQSSEMVSAKCKIIAEIGINHGGDIGVAKKLIKKAKLAGCWGVKFQFRDVESFYKHTNEVSDKTVYDELRKNSLSIENVRKLGEYSKKVCIKFGVSVFRMEDLTLLSDLDNIFDFFKVPSAECLNTVLIYELVSKGRPVFVSTGGVQTRVAVASLKEFANTIIPFHCIANYPSKLGGQDLDAFQAFTEAGFKEVGYSSHDEEWEVCLLALANGAQWIERHITLNKLEKGLDHSSSSSAPEIEKLVKFAESYKNIIGNKYHEPNQGELINLQNLGTSIYAKNSFSAGTQTNLTDFEIKAPRTGLSVGEYLKDYQNRPLLMELKKDTSLTIRHFDNQPIKISDNTRIFANDIKLGLPVRLHDYSILKHTFGLTTYEFHLSFSEVMKGDLESMIDIIGFDENISVHLPDYIPGSRLLDPLSRDNDIRSQSRKIIETVSAWSKKIEDKISRPVNIIGSFSCTNNQSRIDNLDQIFDYISLNSSNILPQWLPVYAWYFGGNVKLNLFNSLEDIEYLVSNNQKICLDVSHLVMAASYYSVDWKIWYKKLYECAEHLHISDAGDALSEGLMIGEGKIGNFSEILLSEKLKIIECWQGHLNGGDGFQKSLNILNQQYLLGAHSHGA